MLDSKYLELAEKIKSGIVSGRYKSRLPGVFRLAEELDASHITISKALKQLASDGIVTIVDKKGTYVTKGTPRPALTHTVALITLQKLMDRARPGVSGLFAAAEAHGYDLISMELRQLSTLTDKNILSSLPVDGFIFYGSINAETACILRQQGLPFVSLNQVEGTSGVSYADHDNRKATMDICAHLLDMGHEKIAYLSFVNGMPFHQDLLRNAFIESLGGHFRPEYFCSDITLKDFAAQVPREPVRIYMEQKLKYLFSLPLPPTAILTESTKAAEIIRTILQEMGLRVPEDVSIACRYFEPEDRRDEEFFTHIFLNERKRSRVAFETLKQLIDNPDSGPVRRLLECRINKRKSVSRIN